MELIQTPRFISTVPHRGSFNHGRSFLPPPALSPNITLPSLSKPGLIYFAARFPKATTSEETSTISEQFDDVPDEERNSKEAPFDASAEAIKLLEKLKLDSFDPYPVLVNGSGALAALWISSAIVGAIDSIPLVPKVLEVVGLGFTVWFSYRYLIFKKNREELSAKVEEIKQEIIGSDED